MKPPARMDAAFAAAFAVLLGLMAVYVSAQSFWIDEIRTGVKVFQPTLRLFWERLDAFAGADICIQMPLYMVLEWIWEKIVGSGEWALRSLNILFAAGSLAALATERTLPRRIRLWTALFLALSPMSAEYMDEARPYALLLFAATLALCGALRFDGIRFGGGPLRFLAGIVLLCAASLTGVPFAAALCACLALRAIRLGTLRACLRANAAAFAAAGVLVAALGAWYLWTLLAGYGGSGPSGTTPATLAFDAYEVLGFLGLGPGRTELRAGSIAVLLRSPASIALPLALAAAYAAFLAATCASWRRRDEHPAVATTLPPNFMAAVAADALACAALIAVGLVSHSRILARHLVPALPVLFLSLGRMADAVFRRLPRGRALLAPLLALLLLSSLRIRFSAVHGKDDYRRAARLATEAVLAGEEVWWAADIWAPEFYGIPPSPSFHVVPNASPDALDATPAPSLAILSKPDIYDRSGILRTRLAELGLAPADYFSGFHVHQPSSTSP